MTIDFLKVRETTEVNGRPWWPTKTKREKQNTYENRKQNNGLQI